MNLNPGIQLIGPGTKGRLWTKSMGRVASNPLEQTSNVVQLPRLLPLVLAGPVVRRVESAKAVFWLATSRELIIKIAVTDTVTGSKLYAYAQPIKVGERLWINRTIVPGPIPAGHLLTYNFDISLTGKNDDEMGFEGDVLFAPDELSLTGQTLPTFFLAPANSARLCIAHGSCRKFQAPGSDATPRLLNLLNANVTDLTNRPSALHLTGDQIYADDVDPGIIEGLTLLGRIMLGWDETIPPDGKRVAEYHAGQRSFVNSHGFTVDPAIAGNHLLGFGDYAAMYILAWSPDIWMWDGFRATPSVLRLGDQYKSPETRKVLANTPTYMICDDHEVTDDWNLNPKWVRDTAGDPVARRIIANALGAYWAFQAVGNDPGRDASAQAAVSAYAGAKGANPAAFESAMLGFHDWHFTAPTSRPTIFLDTRTRRQFAPAPSGANPPGVQNPPPGLLNDGGFRLFESALAAIPSPGYDAVLIVSPGPFIGYRQAEEMLKNRSHVDDPAAPIDPFYDPESWSFDTPAFVRFFKTLARSGHKRFVILSGDVHYSFTAFASCTVFTGSDQVTFSIVQATCSAIHNAPD